MSKRLIIKLQQWSWWSYKRFLAFVATRLNMKVLNQPGKSWVNEIDFWKNWWFCCDWRKSGFPSTIFWRDNSFLYLCNDFWLKTCRPSLPSFPFQILVKQSRWLSFFTMLMYIFILAGPKLRDMPLPSGGYFWKWQGGKVRHPIANPEYSFDAKYLQIPWRGQKGDPLLIPIHTNIFFHSFFS